MKASPTGNHPADVLPPGELTLLWREIYANYPVPLPFTEDELARFIEGSGVDLPLSQVATVGDTPVGLSLAARSQGEAWIGGFGVVAAHRRTGVGSDLLRHQCRVLEAAGIVSTRLEVMTTNKARRLYASAGFIDRRRLDSFNSAAVGGGADPLEVIPPDDLARLHRRMHVGVSAAPWQRELEAVERAVRRDRLTILGWRSPTGLAAYAVEQARSGVTYLIDAAAENDQAAEALIASLAARTRGRRLSLADEPAQSPIARAFKRFGATPRTQRFEMLRLNPPSSVAEPAKVRSEAFA
ncbi:MULTISPECIES: GNAT family N-acetyltransferase [unclassified Brevundimonas]|uniref:GNAT family N-acetyltransferase n=1 Tax=unclassified Brevundimonas TaxID=2622653 RepID=UPI003F923632